MKDSKYGTNERSAVYSDCLMILLHRNFFRKIPTLLELHMIFTSSGVGVLEPQNQKALKILGYLNPIVRRLAKTP